VGVRTGALGTSITNWPIVSALDEGDQCGACDGLGVDRRSGITDGEISSVLLRPNQIPNDLNWNRSW
jgi:hypothetical protein